VASTLTRRPLPALVSLLALLLLTAIVWFRVLHRGDAKSAGTNCPTPTPTATTTTLPAPSKVTVQVLNATTRSGIAARARTTLGTDGFQVPKFATNDAKAKINKIPGVAEIRYGPTGQKGAKLLSFYFPGATLVPTQGKTATVEVALGNKYKRVASTTSVEAALRAQHITLETPTPQPSGSPSC
jgi:LytR cell envelope-related transcriptional attenuator